MAQNGKLDPVKDLVPIIGGGRLEKNAGRAWNAFARYCQQQHGVTVQVTSSYRPLGKPGDGARYKAGGPFTQWAAWELYQAGTGNLAARPSTSNHGFGTALDVPGQTQSAIHRWGAQFGWVKIEAPTEAWHFNYRPGKYPAVKQWRAKPGQLIMRGDSGPAVVELTKLLRRAKCWPYVAPSRSFGPRTRAQVVKFQKAHGLTADGVVGPRTWAKLRAIKPAPKPTPAPPKPKPTPPKPSNGNARLFADIFSGEPHFDAKAYRDAGHRLVALKVSEGMSYQDPPWAQRAQAARKAGLAVFAYHFARPGNGNSPESEAKNFTDAVKKAGPLRRADRLVLDWEDPKFESQRGDEWVAAFIKAVKRNSGAEVRVLYSGAWYLPGTLRRWPSDTTGKPLRYWHAAYTKDPASNCPAIARPHLWAVQYTDGAAGPLGPKKAAGIGPCDMNRLV